MKIRQDISEIRKVLGQEAPEPPTSRPPPEYAYYVIAIVPGAIPTPLNAFERQEDAEQWAAEQAEAASGGRPVIITEVRGEKRWKTRGRRSYICMRYMKYDPWM